MPFGAANFSDTKYGIPVFISMPHFLKADPYYLSLIDGLKPDANIHQSAMTVEPVSTYFVKNCVEMCVLDI